MFSIKLRQATTNNYNVTNTLHNKCAIIDVDCGYQLLIPKLLVLIQNNSRSVANKCTKYINIHDINQFQVLYIIQV